MGNLQEDSCKIRGMLEVHSVTPTLFKNSLLLKLLVFLAREAGEIHINVLIVLPEEGGGLSQLSRHL